MAVVDLSRCMRPLEYAEYVLDLWTSELKKAKAALTEDPNSRDKQRAVEHAEAGYERARAKASEEYNRECEAEYAAQWASEAYGPDVNPSDKYYTSR